MLPPNTPTGPDLIATPERHRWVPDSKRSELRCSQVEIGEQDLEELPRNGKWHQFTKKGWQEVGAGVDSKSRWKAPLLNALDGKLGGYHQCETFKTATCRKFGEPDVGEPDSHGSTWSAAEGPGVTVLYLRKR